MHVAVQRSQHEHETPKLETACCVPGALVYDLEQTQMLT